MRWCPRCGRPKEFHDKVGSSAKLPKGPPAVTRDCLLIEHDAFAPQGMAFRADDKKYAKRQAAYDEERKMAPADRREALEETYPSLAEAA